MARSARGLVLVAATLSSFGAQEANDTEEHETWRYGSKGLEFETESGNTFLWAGLRLQLRYTSTVDDPSVPEEPLVDNEWEVRRARFKLGGHLFRPWFAVYTEHDFPSETLIDLRTTLGSEALKLRVGQWKSDYNRERVDSSGKQQLVERSISTFWFTIDRQQGASLSGRLGAGSAYDSSYWLELLSGQGRGNSWEDGEWMAMARYQWNFLGRVLPFSQSDLANRQEPAGSLSLAGVVAETPFTRFSGDGGGQLPGLERGDYDLVQLQQGGAYHYRGFSIQEELHFKSVRDDDSEAERDLLGGYVSVGTFPASYWTDWPRELELAARAAIVDPNLDSAGLEQEWTLGANWFFNGHRNKLSADVAYLTEEDPGSGDDAVRFRVQWDVSF